MPSLQDLSSFFEEHAQPEVQFLREKNSGKDDGDFSFDKLAGTKKDDWAKALLTWEDY